MSCGACGDFGHNVRTCAIRAAVDRSRARGEEIDRAIAVAVYGAYPSPAAPEVKPEEIIRPEGLGPWSSCWAGDPWCPCAPDRRWEHRA